MQIYSLHGSGAGRSELNRDLVGDAVESTEEDNHQDCDDQDPDELSQDGSMMGSKTHEDPDELALRALEPLQASHLQRAGKGTRR